ncbi:MAG TPA: ABC transporter permease [Sedimentisphaerales bacterium]|nr:ABC transporter permease [Sedimentisphaerales bacterium]
MALTEVTYGFEQMRSQLLQALTRESARAAGFIRKDMTIAISYKLQFVFQFSQVFFGVAIIYFIGKMLGHSGKSPLLREYGADYFAFALVGLAVTSYLKTGLVTITNDIRQIMNQGTLEAMCAAPVGYKALLLYTALWPFVFETIRVVFYFLIGMIVFGMRFYDANWIGAAVTMILTIPIFLLLGIISSSILIIVKRGDPINWFFSSAASLLAGTMFPVAVFPGWLRAVAFCLPLTHSLEAMRKCLLAGASVRQVCGNLLALLLFMAVLLPVAIVVNNVCMARAKKTGAFTTH